MNSYTDEESFSVDEAVPEELERIIDVLHVEHVAGYSEEAEEGSEVLSGDVGVFEDLFEAVDVL